jgi:azurin
MKLRIRMTLLIAILGASLLISACGGGSAPAPAASSGKGTGPVTLELGSDGERLAFKPDALSVSAGQKVTIKLTDNSASQQHNWALIKGGANVAKRVATAGLLAGADTSYLPTDSSDIIASTPLLSAGQMAEVTFTAPASGTNIFICTVPGHYPIMQGTLTVQ